MAGIAVSPPSTNDKKRKNLAVTNDGSHYNKRQRPDFTYTQEPPTDIAHLGHPELQEEDVYAKGPARQSTNSRTTLFDYRDRDTGINRGRTDAVSGQKITLPIPEGDGSASDEDTNAVWRYLRAVRSEAARLPSVAYAPKPTHGPDEEEEEEEEYTINVDEGGYFSDGAYVAGTRKQWQPDTSEDGDEALYTQEDSEDNELLISPQESYTERLKARFLQHRALLNRGPPPERISALKDSHLIWVPDHGHYLKCKSILRKHDPIPAQVASMNKETVSRLLGIAARTLPPEKNITKRASMWIWSLLARLPGPEMMDNFVLHRWRQTLGKRAVVLRALFDTRCEMLARKYQLLDQDLDWDIFESNDRNEAEPQSETEASPVDAEVISTFNMSKTEPEVNNDAASEHEQAMDLETSDEEGEINEEGEIDKLAEAREKLLRNLSAPKQPIHEITKVVAEPETPQKAGGKRTVEDTTAEDGEPFPNLNTRVTLDMMITIIGDIYGQRDLLECRADWNEDLAP